MIRKVLNVSLYLCKHQFIGTRNFLNTVIHGFYKILWKFIIYRTKTTNALRKQRVAENSPFPSWECAASVKGWGLVFNGLRNDGWVSKICYLNSWFNCWLKWLILVEHETKKRTRKTLEDESRNWSMICIKFSMSKYPWKGTSNESKADTFRWTRASKNWSPSYVCNMTYDRKKSIFLFKKRSVTLKAWERVSNLNSIF